VAGISLLSSHSAASTAYSSGQACELIWGGRAGWAVWQLRCLGSGHWAADLFSLPLAPAASPGARLHAGAVAMVAVALQATCL